MPREVFGDATQNGDWAGVRLAVEGDRIVESDAQGLERPLAGLTLLEAAGVPGEPLAVEALATALGQVFTAKPVAGRIAVAMSGGVDSAVALHRAGHEAIGVTLRLWQDPAGPSAERACCSPAAVAAARATCHALGLPHVTLDLREEFRAEVVAPFVDSYRDGETPNPCTRCNGAFRFDALLEFAERAGAAKLWTGHYARIVERDGSRLLARGLDPEKDQSYMLATVEPELLERVEFPLGEQTKDETRAEARAAGLAAAGRAESQEACFLAGDDYRRLPRAPGPRIGAGRRRRRARRKARRPRRLLALHARSAARGRGRGRASALRPPYRPRREHGRRRPSRVARGLTASRRRDRCTHPSRRRMRSFATGPRPWPRTFGRRTAASPSASEQAAYGVAPGQVAVLYDGDVVVGAGVVTDVS